MGKEKTESVSGKLREDFLLDERGRRSLQSALIEWFRKHGRDYPWRRTRDPYAILVSELMLQQTRIQTVLDRGYYENWMIRFPDCKTLAGADEQEILKAWEGLGYYNRARNLQKAAAMVVHDFGGRFPDTSEEILKLPGVGRYTAGAVLSFAFGKSHPIVDGNVIRVLARLFASLEPVDTSKGKSQMWIWAEELTPKENAREYNSAIMELGQRICHRAPPLCKECPVSRWCKAGQDENPEFFPVKGRAKKVTDVEERVVLRNDSAGQKIWLVPETGSRRNGLWKLPEISDDKAHELAELLRIKYTITRYRVTLIVYKGEEESNSVDQEGQWFSKEKQGSLPPMGSPYLRVLKMLEG